MIALYDRIVRVSPRRQLLAGTAALFVLRLALSTLRTGPVLVADEVGYLTNARALAGGVRGQMTGAPFYHGGYSLLLAPLLALDHDPTTSYHLVLALNALLAAGVAPLVYFLLTRRFAVSSRVAVWPSLAAGAYPSVTIFSQVALSENLLVPLIVVWSICFGGLLQAPTDPRRTAWASSTSLCAVWLWAAHGRMIIAVALTIVALIASAVLEPRRMRAALVGLLVIACGLVAVHELDHFLVDRNWGGHAPSEINGPLSMLESLGGLVAFLRNLVGQTWYLLVATLGVLVASLSLGRPHVPRRRPSSSELVLALLLLTGIGLLFESALSFRTVDRPDTLVYGRYTEVVVPPLLALALARIDLRRYAALPTAVLLALATGATALIRASFHPPGGANRWNIASLPAPARDLAPEVLVAAGAVAVLAVVVLATVRRRAPAAVVPLVLVLFLPTTAAYERNPVLFSEHDFYPAGWTSPAPVVGDARTIAFDTQGGGELWADQWFASKAKFLLFSGSTQSPPAGLVISSPAWAAAHADLHPKPVWNDPRSGTQLYRLRAG